MALELESDVASEPVILEEPERVIAYWPISEGNCIISLDTGQECSVKGGTKETRAKVQSYLAEYRRKYQP